MAGCIIISDRKRTSRDTQVRIMTPKIFLAACVSVAIFMPHLADAQGGRGGRGGHGGAGYYQPGYQVQILPPGYTSLRVGLSRYYYDAGVFYRPVGRPPAYVVVPAPFGARVSRLPLGYVGFFIGPSQYSI